MAVDPNDPVLQVVNAVNRQQEAAVGEGAGPSLDPNDPVMRVVDQVNRTEEAAAGTMALPTERLQQPLGYGDEFARGFGRGVDQLQMSLYSLSQLLGREMGWRDVEDYGFRGIENNLEEIQAMPISVEGFTEIESFEDFTRWLTSSLGNAIPSMGAVIAGGSGAGALTSAIGKKAMERRIYHTLRDRMVRNMQRRNVYLTEEEAILHAHNALQQRSGLQMIKDGLAGGWDTTIMRTPGFARGAKVGAFVTSAGMQTGETEMMLTQEGFASPQTAILTGLAGGALEAMPAVFVINRLFPGQQTDDVIGFLKDFGQVSKTGIGQRIAASGTVKGLLAEGSTEAGQEFLQLAALAYHDPTFDLADPANADQIINAFAQGAVAGAFFGGATDVVGYAKNRQENKRNVGLKRRDRSTIPKFTLSGLTDKVKGGWPEGFTPADNTVFEEVRSRVDGVVRETLEPAFNTIRDQFDTFSRQVDETLPGLNDSIGQFRTMVKNAHEEFIAGHQPIIDDAVRYAKEQTAWVYEQAANIADPAKRKQWVDEQTESIRAEVEETAAFIRDRANKMAENIAKKVKGSQSVAMDEQLAQMFPNLDLSSKDADTFRGNLTILDSDPEFTFGKLENYTDRGGARRRRRTKGQHAQAFKDKRSAENAIPRIAKEFPSASESSFEAVEIDGEWFVRITDQGQREALIEDIIVNESLEGARATARGWDKRKEGAKRRQVKLEKSRSLIDVPTLVLMSRRLGDTYTMRQGFDSISAMMIERGIITDRDFRKMNEAFSNFFTKEEQEMTLAQARQIDDDMNLAGTEFSNVRQVLKDMSKDARRTGFDRLTDVTEEMGDDLFDPDRMEAEAKKVREENEARDMGKRGRPVKGKKAKRKPLTPKQKVNKAINDTQEEINELKERIKKGQEFVKKNPKNQKAKDLLVELQNTLESAEWSLANLRRHKARKNFASEEYVLTKPEPMPTTEERLNSIRKTAFVLTGMNPDATIGVQEIVNKVAQMLPGRTKIRVITRTAGKKMVADKHPHAHLIEEGLKFTNDTDASQAVFFDPNDPAGIAYIITADFNQDPAAGLWGLVHELGHLIHFDSWAQLSYDQQKALWRAFIKDVREGGRTTGAVLPEQFPDTPAEAMRALENMYEFREWMADQFVNWMQERKAPRNALQRFMESVARKLDDLFAFMKRNESRFGKLNETYAEFADAVAKNIRTKDATGKRQFFLNEAANGKPMISLFQSHSVAPKPFLTKYEQNVAEGRRVWAALKKRVNEDYPELVKSVKKTTEQMKHLYRISLAPSVSTMREIGKRVPTANDLVSIFNRDVGVAKRKRNYHDRMELVKGSFMNRYDAATANLTESEKHLVVTLLLRAERKNDATVLDGDDKVAKAAREVRQLFDDVHTYMKDAGLPVGKIPNYFPRIMDRNMLVANEDRIIQYLASKYKYGSPEKKLAKARAEFMKLTSRDAEEAGALAELRVDPLSMQAPALGAMKHRTTNDPFWAQFHLNNLDAVVGNYVIAVAKRGEYNRFFGEHAPEGMTGGDSNSKLNWNGRKKLELMLREARNEGATKEDLKLMKDFVDANLGMYGRDAVPDKWRTAMATVIAYQNMRTLLFTVFASLPDMVGPAIRTGQSKFAYKSMIKNMRQIVKTDGDYAKMARAWGQISSAANQHVLTEYVDNHYMPPLARKMNNAFFKWTGLNAYTDFTRKAALAVGIDYVKQQHEILTDNTKGEIEQRNARRALKELGLSFEAVDSWLKNGEATWGSPAYSRKGKVEKYDQLVAEGLIQFINESILKPNASQRPLLASHPGAMLVYHLKGFMYAIHETVIKRMAHNINRSVRETEGKADRAMQIAILSSPALMMMALTALGLELRELVTQQDRSDKMDGWEYTWELFERSGLMGITQLGYNWADSSTRGQAELAAMSGPTASHVGELLSRPASQTIPKSIPVVSQIPWLREAVRDYTPL